ncbi:TPA: isopenicillin N synthase family oxygenase [Yersinia enterocolitica]|nr:isopenicillin N synthase family oxygenase [Yersinia enterocolitica]
MKKLNTFTLPETVSDSPAHRALGTQIVAAWRKDGIIEVRRDEIQEQETRRAFEENQKFFARPLDEKRRYVDDLTFSGYVASGEEKKSSAKDFPEVFTIFPDISVSDERVRQEWPCHGPVPWPSEDFQNAMTAYIYTCSSIGHRLMQLTALGMGLELDTFTRLCRRPWNYMRVLQFPAASVENSRGIGAHTDYDFFVISSQDLEKQGLFIRPPVEGEHRFRNWLPDESMRGVYETQEPWNLVEPNPGVFTVFPGDMMQLVTDGYLLSTPHKVALYTSVRRAMPVFIGPDFDVRLRPHNRPDDAGFHYGEHVTNMHVSMYKDRSTSRRIVEKELLRKFLAQHEARVA